MILTDDRHPAKCLARMEELRKSGRLCDVVIEADEHEFRAHRVVLAGCSPYFTAMFTSDLEESKHRVVAIRDISAPTMALLIDYCYSSEIELTEDNVQYLLSAASILQLVWVRTQTIAVVCIRVCEFSLPFSPLTTPHPPPPPPPPSTPQSLSLLPPAGK